MTTETPNTPPAAGDMLRITADNLSNLFKQMAEHIDTLEAEVVKLHARITELEAQNGTN
jgi:cell division protein FtsB